MFSNWNKKEKPFGGLSGFGGGATGLSFGGSLVGTEFVDYLFVGGGGGYYNGGAGGYLTGSNLSVDPNVLYSVVVGSPGLPTSGPGGSTYVYPPSSPTSFLGNITAIGGGSGNATDGGTGNPGGSGGGNFGYPTCNPVFAGISPPACTGGTGYNYPGPLQQGYPGGDGFRGPNVNNYFPRNGGGGGGAGGRGEQGGPGYDGAGGAGLPNSITGTDVIYAAGGPSPSGVTYGGGGTNQSGIVVFRYPIQYREATTSGTVTATTYSTYRVYQFTGPGTIIF